MQILVTEPLPGKGIELLSARYEVTVGVRGEYDNESRLCDAVAPFDALLTCLSNPVTRNVILAAPNLKIISNYAVGYNNIDVRAAKERGILVANTPDVLTEATADCALALLLGVARRLIEAENNLRSGNFTGWDPYGFLGTELHGKKAGIIGMGRIGRAFARRAAGFGMSILYYNRTRLPGELESKLNARYVDSVDNLVSSADIISIHCPLTPDTKHLLNSDRLALMKPGAIIINTARGPIVDEKALADALHEHKIGGAGLDVYEMEPEIHPDLLSAPNCMLLPHIGSATRETRSRMSAVAASSIISHFEGKPDNAIPTLVYKR